jgi:hypothetical protein
LSPNHREVANVVVLPSNLHVRFDLVFIWAGPRDHSLAGFIPTGMCQNSNTSFTPRTSM